LVRIVISRLAVTDVTRQDVSGGFPCPTVKIGFLDTEKPYPITHALRVGTRFGPTVLSIHESEFALKKLFLPRRYSEVITDEDIGRFNKAKMYLIYRGVCEQTNGFLLSITGEEAGYS
jgi:hypothetical protein